MATGGQSSTPSFFNFLKEGLLLPSHNRRLFAAVFAITAASTCLLLFGNDLVVQPLILQPLRVELDLDTKALNSTDPSSPDTLQLIRKTQEDTRALFLTSTADLVFTAIIRSAIQIVVLFAAVATYSGELHTFRSLLGKIKKQLKGPVVTLAFGYALEIAYIVLLIVMYALVMVFIVLVVGSPTLAFSYQLVVGSLLLLAPFIILFVYFGFVCSMSVVVAVAEPGCHGTGALRRAWRLMKGKRRRAVLFIFVTGVIAAALPRAYNLAKTCALGNMAAGLLLGFLYSILTSAVQVFAACAMTAFYYECKGNTEASAVGYVKVSTKEQIDV